jgi:hypothetical protein
VGGVEAEMVEKVGSVLASVIACDDAMDLERDLSWDWRREDFVWLTESFCNDADKSAYMR